jgi:hypothetical protein
VPTVRGAERFGNYNEAMVGYGNIEFCLWYLVKLTRAAKALSGSFKLSMNGRGIMIMIAFDQSE